MASSLIKRHILLAVVTLFVSLTLYVSPALASENADEAREQAKKILENKKYGESEERPLSEDAQRLTRWLGEGDNKGEIKKRSDEQIRRESAPNRQSQITPPAISGLSAAMQVVLWVLLAVLIGFIGFMIFKFVSKMPDKKNKDKEDEYIGSEIDWNDEESVLDTVTDADVLEQLSEKAEAEGHLDLALRYRFRAGLLRLNDIDIITFHPSITNAQWQLIINQESFNTLTRDFNDVTYGEQPCEIDRLQRARSNWSSLIEKKKSVKGDS